MRFISILPSSAATDDSRGNRTIDTCSTVHSRLLIDLRYTKYAAPTTMKTARAATDTPTTKFVDASFLPDILSEMMPFEDIPANSTPFGLGELSGGLVLRLPLPLLGLL